MDSVDERQSFLQDDDDDTLLFEKLPEHVLEKYPNPERIGCIDHSTLKTWVYSPQKLPTVVLPRRVVTAHVILPNFSPGGNCALSITTDRNGALGKATGRAIANV
jgi:hypothetical protein